MQEPFSFRTHRSSTVTKDLKCFPTARTCWKRLLQGALRTCLAYSYRLLFYASSRHIAKECDFLLEERCFFAFELTWCEVDWRESVLRSSYTDKNMEIGGSIPIYRSANELKTDCQILCTRQSRMCGRTICCKQKPIHICSKCCPASFISLPKLVPNVVFNCPKLCLSSRFDFKNVIVSLSCAQSFVVV